MKRSVTKIIIFSILFFVMSPIKVLAAQSVGSTTGRAVVTVESYSVTEGSFAPGNDATLAVVFRNMNTKSAIENVLVSAVNSNGAVLPIEGESNQLYIPSIPAGGTVTQNIKVRVSRAITDIREYTIIFYISYVDPMSQGQSSYESVISIPKAANPSNIDVLKFETAEKYQRGLKSSAHVAIESNGVADAEDAIITINGDIKKPVEYTVESITTGVDMDFDFGVEYTGTGERKIALTVTYKDAGGNVYSTKEKEITVNVTGSPEELSALKNATAKAGTESPVLTIMIVNLIMLTTVILILIYIRKVKFNFVEGRKEVGNGNRSKDISESK